MKKRPFQILDEMNLHDSEKGTSMVGVCTSFISGQMTKEGAQIVIGAPQQALVDILSDKSMPILLIVDKKAYQEFKK
jgi:hypothetical protein